MMCWGQEKTLRVQCSGKCSAICSQWGGKKRNKSSVFQAAEKEAALAKQEEERAEQRKQARAEKKASKKAKKTRIGDKRKADEDDEGEWGQEEGKNKIKLKFQASGNGFIACLVVEGAEELPALVSLQGCFLLGSLPCGSEMQTRLNGFIATEKQVYKNFQSFLGVSYFGGML